MSGLTLTTPDLNRSTGTATDIWQTLSDAKAVETLQEVPNLGFIKGAGTPLSYVGAAIGDLIFSPYSDTIHISKLPAIDGTIGSADFTRDASTGNLLTGSINVKKIDGTTIDDTYVAGPPGVNGRRDLILSTSLETYADGSSYQVLMNRGDLPPGSIVSIFSRPSDDPNFSAFVRVETQDGTTGEVTVDPEKGVPIPGALNAVQISSAEDPSAGDNKYLVDPAYVQMGADSGNGSPNGALPVAYSQNQQNLRDLARQNYIANTALTAQGYEAFLGGLRQGGISGDLTAISGAFDLFAGGSPTSRNDLLNDSSWLSQVNALAGALQKRGISGGFATAQAGASLVAHALGYHPTTSSNAIPGAAQAWANAASALGDLSVLTASGPGSLVKDLNDAQAGVDLLRLLSSSKSAAIALGNLASGIGDVAGIIQGFEQGGIVGGVQAGFSADMLALLLGASGGTAVPIAIVVGAVSAIFGGSHEDPKTEPDKLDTLRYGQGVADLRGTAGASGQNFVESTSLTAEFGGRTGISAIEETLAEYGSSANSPLWLRPVFDKLESIFGESAVGSGMLQIGDSSGKSVNNQQVLNANGLDGNRYQYTDLANALYDFATRYANALASGTAAPLAPLTVPSYGVGSTAGPNSTNGSGGYRGPTLPYQASQDFYA